MVLGDDADLLGGLTANSSGWLGASDEAHCGKMATLKVSKWGPPLSLYKANHHPGAVHSARSSCALPPLAAGFV
jgi:hypothetical protein